MARRSAAKETYRRHVEHAAAVQRSASILGRDIAPLPAVEDPARRSECAVDLRRFCETYFARTFCIPFSDDHIKVISRIEASVLDGNLFAMAMPRGSGKTSLIEAAALWACLFGHREYVAIVASDETAAEQMLDSIKVELETNDTLLADFPEVCHPIRRLDRIHQRASGQTCNGRPTFLNWTAREITLPTIPGSPASGTVLAACGITGRIRGMKSKRADGSTIRPSLVLIDDPQNDESANSPTQCETRERILAGAVLGLAGPGRKIAGLAAVTVIRPDDLADRILDRDKHPLWQGERTKLIYKFPRNQRLWAEYEEIYTNDLRADRGTKRATQFYRKNRARMDAGAAPAWPQRYNADEISAVQHAMNLRIRDPRAFAAEYQNEPLPSVPEAPDALTVDGICARVNGADRGVCPADTTVLSCFVDVQAKALYWLVVAWRDDMTGAVVDYGAEPDQKSDYFTLAGLRRTLERASPGAGLEGSIYAGLVRLSQRILARDWPTAAGGVLRVGRCLVDANWGQTTGTVYRFAQASPMAGIITPSHGRYVGASSQPIDYARRKPGERVGDAWRLSPATGSRPIRHVSWDTNHWKSLVAARLRQAPGDPGALTLFGRRPDLHRMLAEHCCAETPIRTTGRGRTVDEWRLRTPPTDNHLWDCLCGNAVAASMQGAAVPGTTPRNQKKRVRFSEMQAARRR